MSVSGSEPRFGMAEERDVMIPMRDGTRVAVDIFRPDGDGAFPALLGMSPYGKGLQTMKIAYQPDHSPIHHTPIEAGNPEYLTARGYVHVIADVRGIGWSEGEYLGWMSKQEAEDGHDLMGGSVIIAPSGEIVAQCRTLGDELIVADCDLDDCAFGKATIFDFAAHRRVEAYGLITERTGAEPPPE